MKMLAAVLHKTPSDLVIEELELKEPGPGEVRIKIAASGLCHTDWETMKGRAISIENNIKGENDE